MAPRQVSPGAWSAFYRYLIEKFLLTRTYNVTGHFKSFIFTPTLNLKKNRVNQLIKPFWPMDHIFVSLPTRLYCAVPVDIVSDKVL